ncbi:hypothetical protein PGTDC60_1574 [Porphyromonas gingivalis TDC60]|nr:hypothetical protein PGTDC60_1574 [Porphyromonas gingivalis TDC60]
MEAVSNCTAEIARDIVVNADIIEFGDLATFCPLLKIG